VSKEVPMSGKSYAAWEKPNWDGELEEFKLQARLLKVPLAHLRKAFGRGSLVTLADADWHALLNTESWEAKKPGVLRAISREKYGDESKWLDIARVLDAGTRIDAPSVARCEGGAWLCSGNTRLSVCRWRGIHPKVWAFDLPNASIPAGHRDERTGEK